MSYTNETTYYGLPLPTGSDKSTFTDNNTAFQAVDAALHTAYEQSSAATEDIVAIKATVANLIQADINFQNDLDTEKGKIVNLQDKEVLQDAAIAAVKADAQDMITAYNEPTATSTHAYSVGDFFIYNDVLYRAITSIAIGDTIVPDTNCTTTNVTTELLKFNTSTLLDANNVKVRVVNNIVFASGNGCTYSDVKSSLVPEGYYPTVKSEPIVVAGSNGTNLTLYHGYIGMSNGALTAYDATGGQPADSDTIYFNVSYARI